MKKILLMLLFTVMFTTVFGSETPPMRILFIGDSLTCYTSGWQHQVATHFGKTYTNLSVGGKRLEWMKYRLDEHLKKDSIYSEVYIYGGCNDAFSYVNLQKSVEYTQMMVDSCNRRGIKPIVVIGYDPSRVTLKTVYDGATTKRSVDRYVELQKMMKSLKNCKVIPMDTTVVYKDSGDGIHLGATGHRKFAEWVIKHY
jgi:lysophospholipase L1-like esterase